jgi:hypothetical protein
MPRRKSTTPTQPPPAPALGVKKVRRTEEYTEAVKPEEKQVTITIPTAPPIEEEEEGFYDAIEDTLDELDFEELLMMRVERLPNFRRDGKAGQRNTVKEFVGTIPFSATFREDIQALYDGGDYRITLLDGQNRYASKEMLKGRKAIYRITVADRPKQQPVIGSNGQIVMQRATPETAPQKGILEILEEQAKISKHMATIMNPLGLQTATPSAPVAPVMPLEEEVTRAVIKEVFASGDESLKKNALAHFLGRDKEPGIWDKVVEKAIDAIAPAIAPVANLLMQALLNNRQAVSNQTRSATDEVSQPAEISSPQLPAAPVEIQVSDTDKLLAAIREGCLTNMAVERIVGAVDFYTTEENSDQMTRFWMLGAEGMTQFLGLPKTIENVGWMASLLRELEPEDNEPEVIQ